MYAIYWYDSGSAKPQEFFLGEDIVQLMQSIPALDYFLAPGVLKTFKKQFKQTFSDMCMAISAPEKEVEKVIDLISNLKTIKINSVNEWLEEGHVKVEEKTRSILSKAYNLALKKTDRLTYQSMEGFVHNLNTLHSRSGGQIKEKRVCEHRNMCGNWAKQVNGYE